MSGHPVSSEANRQLLYPIIPAPPYVIGSPFIVLTSSTPEKPFFSE